MKRAFIVLPLIIFLLTIHQVLALSVSIGNPNVLTSSSLPENPFRWGNVSMVEVSVTINFTVSSNGDYHFIIPQSWSVQSVLSNSNQLYKIYYVPIDPFFSKPNEMLLTFIYDIYVAPPQNSTPYDFSSRVIINSPEEEALPNDAKKVADQLFSNAETYYEAIYRAVDFVSDYLTYDNSYVSKSNVGVQQIWTQRRGVCRHYAKLLKAFLDYAGIQNQYASGFLLEEYNGKTYVIPHAWLVVYDPVNGWFPVDPTNHNFQHVNDFKTGVIYPLDVLVSASKYYHTNLELPVTGDITVSDVKTTFRINNIKPLSYLNITLYKMPNGYSFIQTEGAGLLIYHPLKQVFTDNSPLPGYDLISKYENSIVEYVPAGYLVPIGFEPFTSSVLLNYYYDVKPKVIDFRGSIVKKKDEILFANFPGEPYFTDDKGEFINPTKVSSKTYSIPDVDDYVKYANQKSYLNIFGLWYYTPLRVMSIGNFTLLPVAEWSSNGQKNILIQVTGVNASEFVNYIKTNYNIEKVIGNEILFSGSNDDLRILLNNKSIEFNFTATQTVVTADNYSVSIDADYTTFRIHLKNYQLLNWTLQQLPKTVNINGVELPVFNANYSNGWVQFSVKTTYNLLVTSPLRVIYLSNIEIDNPLVNPTLDIESYFLHYINPSQINAEIKAVVHFNNPITQNAIIKFFGGIIIDEEDNTTYTMKFSTIIPSATLSPTMSIVLNVFGKAIPVSITINKMNTLHPSNLKIVSYSYGSDSVSVTIDEKYVSDSPNADTPTLLLLRLKNSQTVSVNGVKIKMSDYSMQENELTYSAIIPLNLLEKSKQLVIDGYPVRNQYSVEVLNVYTKPGLEIKGVAPLGSLSCNYPFTLEPSADGEGLIAKVGVDSAYTTVTCSFNGQNYTIIPQFNGVVSVTFSDTTRIDDVCNGGSCIYAGYDGVVMSVAITKPPSIGEYIVYIDDKEVAKGSLETFNIPIPEGLSVGQHTVKVYDDGFLVYKLTFTVKPQPLTLKLLHLWYLISIIVLVIIGLIVSGIIRTEPYPVAMSKRMFPQLEFVGYQKQGVYDVVIMYDVTLGQYVFVYFYKNRMVAVNTARY